MEVELISYSQPLKKDEDKNPLSRLKLIGLQRDVRRPGIRACLNTSALRSMSPVSVEHFWRS